MTGVELLGRSAAIARLQEFVRRVAALDGSVLLVGEAGSDAESVARELHHLATAESSPFVSIECSAQDLDRILFGDGVRDGSTDLESVSSDSSIAAARGGTLFLQNIGDLPAGVQARLARLARDREMRINGQPLPAAIRLIASASPGIDSDVKEHRFRSDLYRRLASSRIDLPPLRARPDDVPAIAGRLLEECSMGTGVPQRAFTQAALGLLAALRWPGNIAELRQVVAQVVASTEEEIVQVEHLLPALELDRAPAPFLPSGTLREARQRFERDYIAAVLQHHGWRIAEAAHTLGIQRPNLYRKARQLGIPLARTPE